jgi:hypothetical protein
VKAALPVIVVLCLLAHPALARQWTSRGGGFTVEAEFVELKDGNVVLKQKDGKVLSAPLDKLSPADVEYVNDLSQPVEMGMGGAPSAKQPPDNAGDSAMGSGRQSDKAGGTICPNPAKAQAGTPSQSGALGPGDAGKHVEVDVAATLADLKAADSDRIHRRLKLLAEASPAEPNPQIAKILESFLVDANGVSTPIRTDAAWAMKVWSTPENVPALLTVLTTDKSSVIRVAAIEAIARHRPPSAIEPLAQQLSDASVRAAADKALKAIGPAAEDAVLKRIEGEDAWTRVEVCDILGAIGTKKSIPALEKAAKDPSWLVPKPAAKALESIRLRERAKGL